MLAIGTGARYSEFFGGEPELALEHFENYLRLSPRGRMATYLNGIGEAYFFCRRFEKAEANLLASLDLAPSLPVTYRVLASCYVQWEGSGKREASSDGCVRSRLSWSRAQRGIATRNCANCCCPAYAWQPARLAEPDRPPSLASNPCAAVPAGQIEELALDLREQARWDEAV
jgi:tetratricopeptide (TPR) repeat protein